jgi:hypothetical protein
METVDVSELTIMEELIDGGCVIINAFFPSFSRSDSLH